MNSKAIILTKILPLVFLCSCCIPTLVSASNQSPLDSIKQVLRAYKIPYSLQEDWMEDLEELEDNQNSADFRELLSEVNEALQEYLQELKVNTKSDARKQSQPKKKKTAKKIDQVGKNISQKVDKSFKSVEVIRLLTKAEASKKRGKNNEAIKHYQDAIEILEEQKKWEKWVEIKLEIAGIFAYMKKNERALNILVEAKEKMRELGDGFAMKKVDVKIATLNKKLNNSPKSADSPAELNNPTISNPRLLPSKPVVQDAPIRISNSELIEQEAEIAAKEAEIAAKEKAILENSKQEMEKFNRKLRRAEESQNYNEIKRFERKIKALELKRKQDEADVNKAKNELKDQQLILAQKEAQLTKQALDQRNLYGGLGILGLIIFFLFFLYRSKRKDHKKISLAYQELAVAQDELKKAEQRIKGLLDQQVSGAVANELISGEQHKKRRFVCVMFLDIRNFTPFVESKTPEEIIDYQNNVLGFMMEKVMEHKGIVNTILGDGFMATFGAPVSAGNDCLQAYKAAVEIMKMVKEKSRIGEIPPTKIGIGMHAGNVVAGNVGTKTRKQYLVTGNTVIIASRLEQLNKQYGSTLIISKEVVEQLPKAMNLPQVFDQVMVKGRSKPIQIAKYG